MGGRWLIALIVAASACGEEEKPCQQDMDCETQEPCTIEKCVDGFCETEVVPDYEEPPELGPYVDYCVTSTCIGGRADVREDPKDLPPDDDPNDCKVPTCLPLEGFANRPNGATCYFAINIEGVCELGKCQAAPSPLCTTYCNQCPDSVECPGCDIPQCVEHCREALVRPCGDKVEAAVQCAVDAGACGSEACAAEVALVDECRADCDATCTGCSCQSSCDGHSFQTSCDVVGGVNICQCTIDDLWVGECSEPPDGCTAANICCHFW